MWRKQLFYGVIPGFGMIMKPLLFGCQSENWDYFTASLHQLKTSRLEGLRGGLLLDNPVKDSEGRIFPDGEK